VIHSCSVNAMWDVGVGVGAVVGVGFVRAAWKSTDFV